MSETFDRQPALRDLLGLIEMMLSRNSSIAGRSPHPRELKERPAIFDARMNCPDKEPASPAPSVKVCAWVTPVPSSFVVTARRRRCRQNRRISGRQGGEPQSSRRSITPIGIRTVKASFRLQHGRIRTVAQSPLVFPLATERPFEGFQPGVGPIQIRPVRPRHSPARFLNSGRRLHIRPKAPASSAAHPQR
jgi:hypothetical protein